VGNSTEIQNPSYGYEDGMSIEKMTPKEIDP
jgi:hypothetical protein